VGEKGKVRTEDLADHLGLGFGHCRWELDDRGCESGIR
jgi:hypothetical protein